MTSFVAPINLQKNQYFEETKETSKGYLYKIKNDKEQTIGYLFGTIHDIAIEHKSSLHDKIFKSLAHSQTLFVELHIDEHTLREFLQNQEGNIGIFSQMIKDNAKLFIAELLENSTSVEALLMIKAFSLGLEVQSLETEASRSTAKKAVEKDEDEKLYTCLVSNQILQFN